MISIFFMIYVVKEFRKIIAVGLFIANKWEKIILYGKIY